MSADNPAWTLELMQYQTWPVTIQWVDTDDIDVTITGATITGRRAAFSASDPDSMTGAANLAGTFTGVSGNDVTYTPATADVSTAGEWWIVLRATNGSAILETRRGKMAVLATVPVPA